jgi:hypothetical protein
MHLIDFIKNIVQIIVLNFRMSEIIYLRLHFYVIIKETEGIYIKIKFIN